MLGGSGSITWITQTMCEGSLWNICSHAIWHHLVASRYNCFLQPGWRLKTWISNKSKSTSVKPQETQVTTWDMKEPPSRPENMNGLVPDGDHLKDMRATHYVTHYRSTGRLCQKYIKYKKISELMTGLAFTLNRIKVILVSPPPGGGVWADWKLTFHMMLTVESGPVHSEIYPEHQPECTGASCRGATAAAAGPPQEIQNLLPLCNPALSRDWQEKLVLLLFY